MIFGINTITVVRDAIVCMIMMMVICFSNFTSDSSSALFGRALRFQHLQKSKTISDYSKTLFMANIPTEAKAEQGHTTRSGARLD